MIFDYHMLNEMLVKIKIIIGIKNFDDTKILKELDQKLYDKATLKNIVALIQFAIKDDANFYPQIFFEAFVI